MIAPLSHKLLVQPCVLQLQPQLTCTVDDGSRKSVSLCIICITPSPRMPVASPFPLTTLWTLGLADSWAMATAEAPISVVGKDAQVQAPQFVEVYDEPLHPTVFENDYVRVLKVDCPMNQDTMYHRHSQDSFFLFFRTAQVSAAWHIQRAVWQRDTCIFERLQANVSSS